MSTESVLDEEVDIGAGTSFGTRVILFNDSTHTFQEVASQLVKAINCSYSRGEEIANEVHTNGKASVFEGELPECLKVSSVLEEIGLHTQIES